MKDTVRQGVMDWTGDNPFVYLKTDPAGDWSSLSLYFRVAASDHGAGHAILVLDRPYEPGAVGAVRLCLTDNAPLARYLIDGFVRKFGLFRPAGQLLDDIPVVAGAVFHTEVSYPARHAEVAEVAAEGLRVALIWEGLGQAFAVDVPPEKSQTGIHEMFSVFHPATSARVEVNGTPLPGTTVDRDFFDRRAQSAALAHSETWVRFE